MDVVAKHGRCLVCQPARCFALCHLDRSTAYFEIMSELFSEVLILVVLSSIRSYAVKKVFENK